MNYIDLHLHLDGSITVEIAKKLANLQNIILPFDNDDDLKNALQYTEKGNLIEFLKRFELPLQLLQTYEGLKEATYLILEDMKNDGNIYVELRFAPQLHCQKGMNQEDAIKAVLEGCKKSDLKSNVILCLMRGEGNEKENEETVRLAKKYLVKDDGVVAIDLAGAESIYPTSKYREIFNYIKKSGIPFTIHSGESEGPEGVKLAIEFGASRIGHGVRITENMEVLELVKERKIPLELCPTSNCLTQAVKSISDYPVRDFLNQGIVATINTDDPAIEGTNISSEFDLLVNYCGLTNEEKKKIILNSVESAFTTDEVKQYLKNAIFTK